MGKVSLEEIHAGMVTADETVAPDGRMLLPAGVALTEKHLKVLKAWGVVEVDVEGISKRDIAARAEEEIDPQHLATVRERVLDYFRHVNLDGAPAAE